VVPCSNWFPAAAQTGLERILDRRRRLQCPSPRTTGNHVFSGFGSEDSKGNVPASPTRCPAGALLCWVARRLQKVPTCPEYLTAGSHGVVAKCLNYRVFPTCPHTQNKREIWASGQVAPPRGASLTAHAPELYLSTPIIALLFFSEKRYALFPSLLSME
jgi:hypothetical protein